MSQLDILIITVSVFFSLMITYYLLVIIYPKYIDYKSGFDNDNSK